jgi:hypothetical protein
MLIDRFVDGSLKTSAAFYSRLTPLPQINNSFMLIPFVHRFFILFGMRRLATAFKSEAKASHSKAGVNACIKALTMVG